jgi:hypothetical protein
MADTLTIALDPEAAERLRRLASASGESVEALAKGVLEETAAEFEGAMGDDAELKRRIAAWKAERASISADDVHAYIKARAADPKTIRPAPTKAE